jgi:hypothetical protein
MKLNTMKLIVFFFVVFSVHSQNYINYSFVVEQKITDSSTIHYPNGQEFEFNYTRRYLKDSLIIENGLFSRNLQTYFKKKNGDWHIKINKNWLPFYKKGKNITTKIFFNSDIYTFRQINDGKIKNVECIIYSSIPTRHKSSLGLSFWFNPKYGVVKIVSGEVSLIRSDL